MPGIDEGLELILRQWLLAFAAQSGRPMREVRKLVYPILGKICGELMAEEELNGSERIQP